MVRLRRRLARPPSSPSLRSGVALPAPPPAAAVQPPAREPPRRRPTVQTQGRRLRLWGPRRRAAGGSKSRRRRPPLGGLRCDTRPSIIASQALWSMAQKTLMQASAETSSARDAAAPAAASNSDNNSSSHIRALSAFGAMCERPCANDSDSAMVGTVPGKRSAKLRTTPTGMRGNCLPAPRADLTCNAAKIRRHRSALGNRRKLGKMPGATQSRAPPPRAWPLLRGLQRAAPRQGRGPRGRPRSLTSSGMGVYAGVAAVLLWASLCALALAGEGGEFAAVSLSTAAIKPSFMNVASAIDCGERARKSQSIGLIGPISARPTNRRPPLVAPNERPRPSFRIAWRTHTPRSERRRARAASQSECADTSWAVAWRASTATARFPKESGTRLAPPTEEALCKLSSAPCTHARGVNSASLFRDPTPGVNQGLVATSSASRLKLMASKRGGGEASRDDRRCGNTRCARPRARATESTAGVDRRTQSISRIDSPMRSSLTIGANHVSTPDKRTSPRPRSPSPSTPSPHRQHVISSMPLCDNTRNNTTTTLGNGGARESALAATLAATFGGRPRTAHDSERGGLRDVGRAT